MAKELVFHFREALDNCLPEEVNPGANKDLQAPTGAAMSLRRASLGDERMSNGSPGDQPADTFTPFQKATRPLISSAADLGVG